MASDFNARSLPFTSLVFDDSTRLYRLEGTGELSDLMVEAWACKDALSTAWQLEISTLSTRSGLDIHAMLGQKLTLQTVLSDGSLQSRSGVVTNAVQRAEQEASARAAVADARRQLAAAEQAQSVAEDPMRRLQAQKDTLPSQGTLRRAAVRRRSAAFPRQSHEAVVAAPLPRSRRSLGR